MDGRAHHRIESNGDVVIVGAGIAGLLCALKLAPRPVTLVSAQRFAEQASSLWVTGGPVAPGRVDSPEAFTADVIAAGGGLADTETTLGFAREAELRIDELRHFGISFDRNRDDRQGHVRVASAPVRRLVPIDGDRTGHTMLTTLMQAVRNTPSIRVVDGYAVEALVMDGDAVAGLQLRRCDDAAAPPAILAARKVVLATGGIGRLYAATTNAPLANGAGLAIAARAGAVIADPEFVQFHPTAMMVGRDPVPAITEALRGAGAILVNRRGQRFMLPRHPLADLAPRDIVARGVLAEIAAGRGAFLDAREVLDDDVGSAYPMLDASCRAAGIDPTRQPIPVSPAAHFHIGGIAVDARGRSSLDGLWAAGEVAATGIHGANCLAGHALLETVVLTSRVAEDIGGQMTAPPPALGNVAITESNGPLPPFAEKALRETMTAQVGVVRDEERLAEAVLTTAKLEQETPNLALRNMATAALLIAASAWSRRESRGAHYRADHPADNPAAAQRTMTTLAAARQVAAEIAANPPTRNPRTLSA
ncbi:MULTISPECIES: L-aspartate oxidase [unclassified Bradyrhizobium]|uniref:L-aspartate oxidase n=1 Tax=unclassified Bradyrhizobium TaxID=2631580 RepID=UPI0028EFB4A9|nr:MULTISPECIES: L-aspartate oxidase [unclassified Bradyrhizobium]